MARSTKKGSIRFKNAAEVISALEKILNIKFTKWSFLEEQPEWNDGDTNFFVKSSTALEDIVIDTRKETTVYISFKDGNGNFIENKNSFVSFNKCFEAEKEREFDKLFDNTVKAVSENRAVNGGKNRIEPDGQMWLF